MNFRILTKNHAADSKIGSPKNRFESRWDSRVSPDSVEVKNSEQFPTVVIVMIAHQIDAGIDVKVFSGSR